MVASYRNSMFIEAPYDYCLIQISVGSCRGKRSRNMELSSVDHLCFYNFLCSFFSYALRVLSIPNTSARPNIVVLVDSDGASVKVLRAILRACQNALAYKIRHAIIIEPDRFLDQQRISLDIFLDIYEFKMTMCSRNKVGRYVEPSSFYNSNIENQLGEWSNIKFNFDEQFASNPTYFGTNPAASQNWGSNCLQRLLKKDNSIFAELGTNVTIRGPEIITMTNNGTLAIEAPPKEEKPNDEGHKTDQISKQKLDSIQISIETCNRLLDVLDHIPKSADDAQFMGNQYAIIQLQFQDLQAELTDMAGETDSQKSHLNTELIKVEQKMKDVSQKITKSLRFHEVSSEFYNEADTLLKSVCTDPRGLDLTVLREELDELKRKNGSVEEKYNSAVRAFTEIKSIMRCERSETDDEMIPIAEQMSLNNERRRRCLGLSEMRNLTLQQLIQLETGENDARQVIEWFKELELGIENGDPITKIVKFIDVAKRLEQYGNQLCEVSLLLRRSLRLDVAPQFGIQCSISSVISRFHDKIKSFKSEKSYIR